MMQDVLSRDGVPLQDLQKDLLELLHALPGFGNLWHLITRIYHDNP